MTKLSAMERAGLRNLVVRKALGIRYGGPKQIDEMPGTINPLARQELHGEALDTLVLVAVRREQQPDERIIVWGTDGRVSLFLDPA